ncbi:uncharacterized protein [Haliotis asinina]|uniref:uncharacterized protein n=1 Tax=Haliotis asinina TaxID=109174 RepID=UPI003531E05B
MAGLQRVEYVKSQKGAPQVFLQGHTYTKNKVRGEFVHWRCTASKCKGKCTTAGDFIVNVSGEHLHPPHDMNDYIVETWVDYEARFPLHFWNHHQTAGPRTNNNLEGFHSRLSKQLPHHHNVYRFVEIIQKVEINERAKLQQINLGAAPPPRKRVYREVDNRLFRLQASLRVGTKTSMEFLNAVGHLLKLG